MPNQDKQPGDNRPSFVAPINPKSPPGKTWRIGAKIGNTWYNQAAFDDTQEDGTPKVVQMVYVISPFMVMMEHLEQMSYLMELIL